MHMILANTMTVVDQRLHHLVESLRYPRKASLAQICYLLHIIS